MSDTPNELKYTQSHEWVLLNDDGSVTIGITDHAQELLGDIVFIELPETGASVDAEQDCAVIESVKAASDIYSPLSGEIIETNESLADAPEQVNTSPYGDGWIFRMTLTDRSELEGLMSADEYVELIEAEA